MIWKIEWKSLKNNAKMLNKHENKAFLWKKEVPAVHKKIPER
jgi:hypothetical protein